MKIGLFGGTGFIGSALTEFLSEEGHEVLIYTRSPTQKNYLLWNPKQLDGWENSLDGIDVIINLVGASIGDKRWTLERKKILTESRILPTQLVVQAIKGCKAPPKLFINASAIGFYAPTNHMPRQALTESDPAGNGFLSQLCKTWEEAAFEAKSVTRVAVLRLGIVLGNGGFLKKVTPVFKLGLGAIFGNGQAPFGWIHITDLCRIVSFAIQEPGLSGPINCVSPEPSTSESFFRTLAKHLKRPLFLRMPEWIVKMVFGEMSELLLMGQYVFPEKLTAHEFIFQHLSAESALRDS